ncbi:MAG: endonuclease III [Prevotella sp.]|nr:endonuclease III [Prevotella sp.]
MTRKERFERVLGHFAETMPVVTTELHFDSAFQLLVATMLSAQCTDKRINLVTPALFRAYPDAKSMAGAGDDLFELIKSVSYPNAKAKHLKQMATALVERFEGEVPGDSEKLESLPGVGRKTANVVLAVWFKQARIAVDTHVFRVSHRLGLVPETASTPAKTEQYLYKFIPPHLAADAHHWLLLHGRYTCQSRRPKCAECPFETFCPSARDLNKN